MTLIICFYLKLPTSLEKIQHNLTKKDESQASWYMFKLNITPVYECRAVFTENLWLFPYTSLEFQHRLLPSCYRPKLKQRVIHRQINNSLHFISHWKEFLKKTLLISISITVACYFCSCVCVYVWFVSHSSPVLNYWHSLWFLHCWSRPVSC